MACGLLALASALQLTVLAGHPRVDRLVGDVLQNGLGVFAALLCWCGARRRAPGRAAAWRLVTGTLGLWALANLLWTTALANTEVSVADGVWLAGYLLLYAALVIEVRTRAVRFRGSVWLDGAIAALGMSAVTGALLWPALRVASHGADGWAVAVNLAYPIADMVMLAMLAGVAALMCGQLGPSLRWMAAGIVVTGIADGIYALRVATGDGGGPLLDALWIAAQLLMALGAWPPPADSELELRLGGWRMLVWPATFALTALGILAWFAGDGTPRLPILLAVATVLAAMARAGLTFREKISLLGAHEQARTDELTGLLNRRGFYQAAEQRLRAAAAQPAPRPLAMLLLDLDHFKELNDTFGHHVGDELLSAIGARLAAALPDAALARLGGDEFAALVDLEHRREAPAAAGRMLDALAGPLAVEDTVRHVGGSVGVAVFPDVAHTRAELLRAADVAMYRAKRHGGGAELYVVDGDHHSRERVTLAGELHGALEDDQLVLHYQPKTELASGWVHGVEALVRWQHPRRGLLYPEAFITLAEQHGLMRRLTLWVLQRALEQRARWAREGLDLSVAVNISPSNLLDARFYGDVAALVSAWRLPAGALQLEITENTVMIDPARALDTLARLGELGITFALDDFGTGYSSLAQLKRLPVAELKIDKSFVIDMLASAEDATIVRSTVEMARSLGLQVVAEGVETAEHRDRLAALGCHTAQGYFLSRPLPPDQLTAWLTGAGGCRPVPDDVRS